MPRVDAVTDPADNEIEPDPKDWSWSVERACEECGFDASALGLTDLPAVIRAGITPWAGVLADADVAERSTPGRWSPLEYACHVRDVCQVFAERTRLMLTQDRPTFDNWDQDVAAVENGYRTSDPATVAGELATAGEAYARVYDEVPAEHAERAGLRGDGSGFTVVSLGRYGAHEIVHHLHDVGVDRPGPTT